MIISDSNLNSLLRFSFELNPGKKRSILSYKHLLYSQFRAYWNLFEQWSSAEIETVGSISPVPAVGAEALRLRILGD